MTYIRKAEKEGKTYRNPVPTVQTTQSLWKMLYLYYTSKAERVPVVPPGPFRTNAAVYDIPPAGGLRITWIGHSTLLIEIDGKRLLTDPVWGSRASFSSFIGPKRFFAAPLPLHQLPHIDGIILSHDHYDHLDAPTVRQLASTTMPVFCSLGVGAIIEKMGIARSRITEMDWGQDAKLGDITITATPARHFSGRSLFNRNRTLWSSFVIRGPHHNIFFGADSGFFPGFADIGAAFGPFDLTMLEIGAYGDGWPHIHMGPENATEAHLALGGRLMMPIHWGTFNLALHAWREPVEKLLSFADAKQIPLFLPEPGRPTDVAGAHHSGWWEQNR